MEMIRKTEAPPFPAHVVAGSKTVYRRRRLGPLNGAPWLMRMAPHPAGLGWCHRAQNQRTKPESAKRRVQCHVPNP